MNGSPEYLKELFPREWVPWPEEHPDHWFLRDKRRDWAMVYRSYEGWRITVFPGNGRHEYLPAKPTLEEAKAAVEARLAR